MGLDRRTAILLGAGALVVAPQTAQACSIALPPPDLGARQLSAVFELLRLWWARDDRAFFRLFDGPRLPTAEGDAGLDQWLESEGRPIAELYRRRFAQEGQHRKIEAVTIVDGRAFVSVREYPLDGNGADCSDSPSSRQFLVDFRDSSPVAIIELPDAKSYPAGQVTHWTSGR